MEIIKRLVDLRASGEFDPADPEDAAVLSEASEAMEKFSN